MGGKATYVVVGVSGIPCPDPDGWTELASRLGLLEKRPGREKFVYAYESGDWVGFEVTTIECGDCWSFPLVGGPMSMSSVRLAYDAWIDLLTQVEQYYKKSDIDQRAYHPYMFIAMDGD